MEIQVSRNTDPTAKTYSQQCLTGKVHVVTPTRTACILVLLVLLVRHVQNWQIDGIKREVCIFVARRAVLASQGISGLLIKCTQFTPPDNRTETSS